MYIKLFKDLIEVDKKAPIYSFISISNKCNANCMFCDVHEKKDIDTKINIINLLSELKDAGTKYVQFTGGGEPLINREIFSYFEEATRLGLNIVFITNGFFMTEDIILKLGQYNIKAIIFSIDSHIGDVHDRIRGVKSIFDRATNAINKIKSLYPDIKIIINHVLNHENIDYINNFIEMSKEVKFDYLNPIIVKECPEYYFSQDQIKKYNNNLEKTRKLLIDNNIELLYDELDFFEENCYQNDGSDLRKDSIPCIFLDYCVFIDCVSGNVYPCDCSVHRDSDYYCIGNLNDNGIKEIFNSKKANDLRKELLGCSMCKNKCDYANMYFNKVLNEEK